MSTVGLTVFKLGVGVLSGSVGVLSEGIHSFLDLISAAVAFFTVREAGKPADQDHPFGHGKIETLSSLFESLLLTAAAGFIVWEAVDHLRNPQQIEHQEWAMGVMAVSIVVSWLVYRQNLKAAQETESSAIHVNALHFLSDVVASLGVLVALVILKFTGWALIDPIIAFAVAGYITLVSLKQVRGALGELTDTQLPEREIAKIRTQVNSVIEQNQDRVIEMHDLRTRRSGVNRHIDFHLAVCGQISVKDSHDICDEIETKVQGQYPQASVTIHVEPCEHEGVNCPKGRRENCEYFRMMARLKEKI